jgi:hypothetical protein
LSVSFAHTYRALEPVDRFAADLHGLIAPEQHE